MTLQRVCVVQFRRIGDVLLTTPLLDAVRRAWPAAHISVLVDRGCHEPLIDHPSVDMIHDVPRDVWRSAWHAARTIGRLRRAGPTVTIDVISTPASAALCASMGAPTRVGFALRARRPFYTHAVSRPMDATYAAHARQALLNPLEIPALPQRPTVARDFADRAWARAALAQGDLRAPFVCISPTSRRAHRRWPLERFGEIARRLADDGVRACVLWGPGERREAERVAECAARPRAVVVAPETPSLRALAGILTQSTLLIGNDNGVRHLAVALDVPTIGLFGSNDPGAWTPPAETGRAAHRTHAGDVCAGGHAACSAPRCIHAIRVVDVMADARDMLSAAAPR